MPGELDSLIAEAERKAERTIALCRIGVSIVLGIAFWFSVAWERPVADLVLSRQLFIAVVTMAGYAVIGAAAFTLSRRGRHRRWHSFLFVTADVIFLHVSIFFAILNTGVTANYMAALPTVWIVPILLAIGAMRYSPVLQGYGMALLLTGFVYALIPADDWRDAVGVAPPVAINPYFTEPPNVMRFVMLGLACAVLVIAVSRTRRLLREALEESRRRQSLTRFLPQEVTHIVETASARSLREGRNQTMVVMFVDIREFTARSETMAPEAVSAFLGRFRAELSAAVAATGGVIDKFIGDGALIVFGLPEPRPTDAAQAVRCALRILSAMAAWSAELGRAGAKPVTVGIGIHMGEAFVGAVGDDTRLEFTVLGDTVNVAARVEEATKVAGAQLLVTAPVLEAARVSPAEWRPLPEMAIRGRRSTVKLYARSAAPAAVGASPQGVTAF